MSHRLIVANNCVKGMILYNVKQGLKALFDEFNGTEIKHWFDAF